MTPDPTADSDPATTDAGEADRLACDYCGIDLAGWPHIEVIEHAPGADSRSRRFCNIEECIGAATYGGMPKVNMRHKREQERMP